MKSYVIDGDVCNYKLQMNFRPFVSFGFNQYPQNKIHVYFMYKTCVYRFKDAEEVFKAFHRFAHRDRGSVSILT